jgi:hypothetical protein
VGPGDQAWEHLTREHGVGSAAAVAIERVRTALTRSPQVWTYSTERSGWQIDFSARTRLHGRGSVRLAATAWASFQDYASQVAWAHMLESSDRVLGQPATLAYLASELLPAAAPAAFPPTLNPTGQRGEPSTDLSSTRKSASVVRKR